MPIPISSFFIKHDIRSEHRGIPDLALEIKAQTLLQPIIVQRSGDDYEILDGRRRFYALRDHLHYAELEENVHFIVREGLHALATQLSANSCRENFTPLEIVALIAEIHRQGIAEHGHSVKGMKNSGWSLEDTGRIINKDKGFVSKALQINENKAAFKHCQTLSDCFENLKKEKEKKLLEKVQKAKVAKVKKAEKDLTAIFEGIHCAAAQDFIKNVPDGSVDLIHIDPPFAIEYAELIEAEYDAPYEDNPDEIMELLKGLVPELYRILRDNRYCIIWCGWIQSFELYKWMKEAGFSILPVPIHWIKLSAAGKTNQPNIRLGSATQQAIVAWKGTPELNVKGRHNYFPFPIVRENRIHQAQMPEELIVDLINIFSSEHDLVFDCFSGSLSTLRAAYISKRRFLGCELQQKNIDNGISFSMDWIKKHEG